MECPKHIKKQLENLGVTDPTQIEKVYDFIYRYSEIVADEIIRRQALKAQETGTPK